MGRTRKKKLRWAVEREGEEDRVEKSKALSAANAKTYEQFTRMAKIHPHKRNMISIREEIDEEWGKYLDKYNLNIRKVRPLYLKEEAEVRPQRIINISEIKEHSLNRNN